MKLMYAVLIGFLILAFQNCHPSHKASPNKNKPNIILILGDDMGFSDLGCYGGEISTPNLDNLAKNGLRFTQFYNAARCCPTRASLLTGLYPQQAGVGHMMYDRGTPAFRGDLSKNAITIAEALKTAGYSTYMSGKWHVTPYVPKDPDKSNWPRQRGFDSFFGMISGAGSYYDPQSLTQDNEYTSPGKDFYATTDFTKYALDCIKAHKENNPFFLYLSYTAAHWPLHAPEAAISKYKGHYDQGWDEVRKARFNRMKKMMLADEKWLLTPRDSFIDPWSSEIPDKDWELANMETYAAMVSEMDKGIGMVMQALKEKGQLNNTLIIYLQDNGACAEELDWINTDKLPKQVQRLTPADIQTEMVPAITREGKPIKLMKSAMPGPPESYSAYGLNWANVSNTPFREYKHWVHEGGISSPLIVHWPDRIWDVGTLRTEPAHLIDIMATCLEVADGYYPESYNGNQITPLEGISLVPVFEKKQLEREALYWEHEGNRAVRQGKWKLVSKASKQQAFIWDKVSHLEASNWELYDMEKDRTEMFNLAGSHPELVKKMSVMWLAWGERTGILPRPD